MPTVVTAESQVRTQWDYSTAQNWPRAISHFCNINILTEKERGSERENDCRQMSVFPACYEQ